LRGLHLSEDVGHVHAAVRGAERREPPGRLLELPLAADTVPAARLVPGHGHVHEPLEKVLLGGLGRAPGQLELLVRGEELAAPDQLDAAPEVAFKSRLRP
jgi:hypothetical protein